MQKLSSYLRMVAGVFVFFLVTSSSLLSQVTWMKCWNGKGIAFDVNRAIVNDGAVGDLEDFTLFLTSYFTLNKNLHLVLQLPFVSANGDYYVYDPFGGFFVKHPFSGSLIGNPYVGIELAAERESSPVLQAGFRFPLIPYDRDDPDNYETVAIAASGIALSREQFEAFMPDLYTIQAAGGYQHVAKGRRHTLLFKVVGGGSLMQPGRGDAELFGDAYFELWFLWRKFELGTGYLNRISITEEIDFQSRVFTQTNISANYVFGNARAGLRVRPPANSGSVTLYYGLYAALIF